MRMLSVATYGIIRRYNLPLTLISIIGKMGSGKTNWGYALLKELREEHMKHIPSIYFQFDWDLVEDFWSHVETIRGRSAYVFIDDMSFSMDVRDKKTREFLQKLTKIRHENPRVKRWFIAVASHYSKATVPFMRQAQIVIATSCTTPEEVKGLSNFFPEAEVTNYYNYYIKHPDEFPALVNTWGVIYPNMVIPYYKWKYWGTVIK